MKKHLTFNTISQVLESLEDDVGTKFAHEKKTHDFNVFV
jgi:hypothetical protein